MSYAEERLELIARVRKQLPGKSPGDALRLDGRALRFHLGTSLADLRVPVSVDSTVKGALASATRDLFFLLSLRHRAVLREAEYDRLILLDGFDPKAAFAVGGAERGAEAGDVVLHEIEQARAAAQRGLAIGPAAAFAEERFED